MPLFNERFADPGPVRTYREQSPADRPRGQSAVEAAADNWLAWEKQQEAKERAAEQRRIDEQNARQVAKQREQQERNRRDRVTQFEAQQHMIVTTMQSYGLTQEEQGELTSQLAERGLANDINAIEFACRRIVELREGG